MKLAMMALFDTKAKAFMIPQFYANPAICIRAVRNAVNDPVAGFLYRNPEDFIIFQLGTWDDATGAVELLPQPENHGMCASFVDERLREANKPFNQPKEQGDAS